MEIFYSEINEVIVLPRTVWCQKGGCRGSCDQKNDTLNTFYLPLVNCQLKYIITLCVQLIV